MSNLLTPKELEEIRQAAFFSSNPAMHALLQHIEELEKYRRGFLRLWEFTEQCAGEGQVTYRNDGVVLDPQVICALAAGDVAPEGTDWVDQHKVLCEEVWRLRTKEAGSGEGKDA